MTWKMNSDKELEIEWEMGEGKCNLSGLIDVGWSWSSNGRKMEV